MHCILYIAILNFDIKERQTMTSVTDLNMQCLKCRAFQVFVIKYKHVYENFGVNNVIRNGVTIIEAH